MKRRIPNRFLTDAELADRLNAERLCDDQPAPRSNSILCRYGHCGGSRPRPEHNRWVARLHLLIGEQNWYVCESCADLLIREKRKKGDRVIRTPLA